MKLSFRLNCILFWNLDKNCLVFHLNFRRTQSHGLTFFFWGKTVSPERNRFVKERKDSITASWGSSVTFQRPWICRICSCLTLDRIRVPQLRGGLSFTGRKWWKLSNYQASFSNPQLLPPLPLLLITLLVYAARVAMSFHVRFYVRGLFPSANRRDRKTEFLWASVEEL